MADFIPQGVSETSTQALENVHLSSSPSKKNLPEPDWTPLDKKIT